MKPHIRTKWHKLKSIMAKGLYLTAPDNNYAPSFEDYGDEASLDALISYIDQVSKLPHFVIDEELSSLATKNEFQQSMYDMKRGNVLRLPYPAMLVEYIDPRGDKSVRIVRNCVLVRDMHYEQLLEWEDDKLIAEGRKNGADFYGVRIGIEEDKDGEYVVASPSAVFISVTKGLELDAPIPDSINRETMDPDTVWMRMMAYPSGVFPPSEKYEKLIGDTFRRDAQYVFIGASAAYLLMSTAGVKKEIINTERINKKRDGVSQPFIPTHTYIRIGHVYLSGNSDRSEAYIPHKSPRPHWRRGHRRLQPFGPGRTSVKEVYIRPRLVAYKGDFKDEPPKPPQYIVTN